MAKPFYQKIKIVPQKQKFKHGCSITCVAMITGESIDDIVKDFLTNFHKEGIDDETLIDYLADKGYAIIEKAATRYNKKDFDRYELLRPFAPAHLVKFKIKADSGLNHWAVMTGKGKLICPMEWTDYNLRNSYKVVKVVGVYKE